MELKLNVYDKEDKVIKTATAQTVELRFGTIRKLMKLMNIESVTDTAALLKVVYGAWEEVTAVLSECFPEIQGDEWDNIKVSELLPVLVNLMKDIFAQILTIPKDPKNA